MMELKKIYESYVSLRMQEMKIYLLPECMLFRLAPGKEVTGAFIFSLKS